MTLKKLTTLLVVERIEPCLPTWQALGYATTVRVPVDLAPTMPEGSHRDWASNTTLAELADIYVLNRGNNSISRMKVDGTVIATRTVSLPGSESLGSAKVNGIATSMDGDTIYVTVTGTLPGHAEEGALLELPAFTAQAGDR